MSFAHIARNSQGIQARLLQQRRPQKARRRLFLEYLEERAVPTILWSSAGSRSVVDSGGPDGRRNLLIAGSSASTLMGGDDEHDCL